LKVLEAQKRPPLSIEVLDLVNLARLAMSRVDVQPLFWAFRYRGSQILGSLLSIPYWRGSLPIFAYIKLRPGEELRGYIGYTNIGFEKAFFTESSDDTRYIYGPVVEIEDPPAILAKSLSSRTGLREKPIAVKARNLASLIRVLMIMSDNMASPPIWHYMVSSKRHILGLMAPFYDYYEANALPVFFYVESELRPTPFIKYQAANGREELYFADSISDMKYFYGRIVTVKEIPFLNVRRRGRLEK